MKVTVYSAGPERTLVDVRRVTLNEGCTIAKSRQNIVCRLDSTDRNDAEVCGHNGADASKYFLAPSGNGRSGETASSEGLDRVGGSRER